MIDFQLYRVFSEYFIFHFIAGGGYEPVHQRGAVTV